MAIPSRTVSEDGIEMQFATNHIGHFLLTNLILGKVKAAALKNPPGMHAVNFYFLLFFSLYEIGN